MRVRAADASIEQVDWRANMFEIQRVEDKMLRAQQERWRREMDDRRDNITLTVTLEFAIQLFQTCNPLRVRILRLTLSAALKLFI